MVRIQVSRKKFHMHIYLDYIRIEFIFCIKNIYIYIKLLKKILSSFEHLIMTPRQNIMTSK